MRIEELSTVLEAVGSVPLGGRNRMMIRIALVSTPGIELEKTRSVFRNPMRFTLREFLSMESVVHGLISFPADVLLLRIPHFTARQLVMVNKALKRFHNSIVLVLAHDIDPQARLQANQIARFKLLQEPLEIADLPALIEKMKLGVESLHRQHPRARRDGMVQVIDKKGVVHRGQFIDFGQMGAKLSLAALEKLQPKDSVQIVYGSTSEPGKFHKIEAKVIWSTFSGGFVDQFMGVKQQTAGIRFIATY